MGQDAALQCGTVQMEAVLPFWTGFVLERGQVAGNCRKTGGDDVIRKQLNKINNTNPVKLTILRQAAGAAAFQRRLLLVEVEEPRSSPLGLLQVDEDPGEPPDPAVLVVGGGGAPGLRAAQQTQGGQQAPCDVHGAP